MEHLLGIGVGCPEEVLNSDVDDDNDEEQEEEEEEEMDEILMDEAGVPVNDEVSNEILIKHDPDNPSIHVGTLFSTMDDFRSSLQQFAINGEFDVIRINNSNKRFEARCKLWWKNGSVKTRCPWRISARNFPNDTIIRVLKKSLALTFLYLLTNSVISTLVLHLFYGRKVNLVDDWP